MLEITIYPGASLDDARGFRLSGVQDVRYNEVSLRESGGGGLATLAIIPDGSAERIAWTLLFRFGEHELKEPIPLEVQLYQGWYLVSDRIVYRHGLGATLEDAIEDYQEALLSYYESLIQRRDKLSPSLSQDLDQLQTKIEKH